MTKEERKTSLKTADNTACTLQANALALQDIAPYGRNVYPQER